VLYQLSTGRQPFQGKDRRIDADGPWRWMIRRRRRRSTPKLPSDVSKLIMKMLEKRRGLSASAVPRKIVDALPRPGTKSNALPGVRTVEKPVCDSRHNARKEKMVAQRTLAEGFAGRQAVATEAKRSRLPLYLGLGGVLAASGDRGDFSCSGPP